MTRRKYNIIPVLLAAVLAASAVLAGGSAESWALDVNRKVLENGLTVLHVEDHHLPMVTLTLLVKAGSADEPPARAGLAHLTAGLLDEGTKSRSAIQISEELEFIGAEMGASAGTDFTTMSLSVLRKNLDKGLDVFFDVLLAPAFPGEEIARVRDRTKASLRQMEENPSYVASRAFGEAVYGEHPYGRPVAGRPETIDAITREDIAGFYASYFIPNNSILAIGGDISPEEVDSLLGRYLAGWSPGAVPERKPPPPPPPARRVVTIDRDITQANIVLGHVSVRRDSPDYYALSVMNYILGGGGFSSRLMDSVRDRMGLAYNIASSLDAEKESGALSVDVQTKNASANTVIEETLRQMRAMAEKGVTERELADAKSFLVGSFPRRIETLRKIVNFLCLVEFYGLGDDYPEKYPGYINSITREDILRVARKYLMPDASVLVVVADQEEAALRDFSGKH